MVENKPIIQITDLYKSFGSSRVLNGINLSVYPGEVIGYIGPNGAGKSTTVKILCGLLGDFKGEVRVGGFSVKDDPLEVKKRIGYVPELAELYDVLTPEEYLMFMADLYGLDRDIASSRIIKILTALGLKHNIRQRMETFSKGMRQKVLLTSGILHNPEIIILDEPLSGLDANSVIIVKELIEKLASSGKTIFYCSHMMDIVEKISDRIVLINNGSIAADGTMESLKSVRGDTSLEKVFSSLTAKEEDKNAAADILESFQM
jgi:ABC-2 type transport system ATP-binding protein